MIHHIAHVALDHKKPVTLFVFGDLQWGAKGFNEEAWQAFRDEFKATPNAWALGLGDYEDWLRPSMRGRIISSASHDDSARTQLDDRVRKMQDDLLTFKMDFLNRKLIGLHEGHHDWEFADRTKSTQRLCSALKAPFLGWTASTRLVLIKPGKSPRQTSPNSWSHTILSTHGNANARRTGGMTAWLENNIMQGWIADHYIMGHCCKSAAWMPAQRQVVRRNGPAGVIKETPLCLQVGGFHEGYTNGWESSYVERSGFMPQPLSWGVIRFSISEYKSDMAMRGLITKKRGTMTLRVEQTNRKVASEQNICYTPSDDRS